jgi:rod shape determining protein RodA
MFSYAFAGMLFIQFFINIGMTLGLVPTVGIPLPFISYGGSSLMAFSLMLFIYLNFDYNRLS